MYVIVEPVNKGYPAQAEARGRPPQQYQQSQQQAYNTGRDRSRSRDRDTATSTPAPATTRPPAYRDTAARPQQQQQGFPSYQPRGPPRGPIRSDQQPYDTRGGDRRPSSTHQNYDQQATFRGQPAQNYDNRR